MSDIRWEWNVLDFVPRKPFRQSMETYSAFTRNTIGTEVGPQSLQPQPQQAFSNVFKDMKDNYRKKRMRRHSSDIISNSSDVQLSDVASSLSSQHLKQENDQFLTSTPLKICDKNDRNHIQMSNTFIEKRYKCDYNYCNKTFKYKASLYLHKRTHSEIKYVCDWTQCKREFTSKSAINKHKSCVHFNEKRYKCDYNECQQRFNQKSSLIIDLRIDSGEKAFICSFNNCDKKFSQMSQLFNHKNRHHLRIKRHKCDYNECNKNFVTLSELKLHINSIHIKEKSYKCHFNNC